MKNITGSDWAHFLLVLVMVVGIVFYLVPRLSSAIVATTSETHYLGSFVITVDTDVLALENIIDKNADYGEGNMWKPGYKIEDVDNGQVFHYFFFSKNKDLPFTKD